MGGKHPTYHRAGLYADAGRQVEGDVQAELKGLHHCRNRQGVGGGCRIHGEHPADDGVYRACSVGAGALARRHECSHCLLFRVHIPDARETGGWDHVLLHVPWGQNRRRHRDGSGRVAAGIQRLCGHKCNAAPVSPYHDAVYVLVAAINF